jgi:hypothetical protein
MYVCMYLGTNIYVMPYIFPSSAAVSFMVAEMFDKSVNIQEITRAAR